MIDQVMETVEDSINTEYIATNQLDILEANDDKLHSLVLPYAAPKGNTIIKSMNNNIQRSLSNNVKTTITYTGTILGTKFQIKDLTKKSTWAWFNYYKCPEPNCKDDYLDETGRIIIEKTSDHCGKDKRSHLLKHALVSNHPVVDLKDLKVIDKSYHRNKYRGRYQGLYVLSSTNYHWMHSRSFSTIATF